jgi:preprotein translocase subunit SecD
MNQHQPMRIIAMLLLFATGAWAGNLFEIAAGSKVAVPESEDMTYAIRDLTEVIHIKRLPLIADENVAEVTRTQDPRDVQVKLSADGTKKFADKISSMADERFAILIQGKIISAPIIKKISSWR